jgi:hypothetical protein
VQLSAKSQEPQHGPLGMPSDQIRDEAANIIEGRLLVSLEVETEPTSCEAVVAVRLLPGDRRRQLERLGEHKVVALQRPAKDSSRMALRGRPLLLSGPRRHSRVSQKSLGVEPMRTP